MNARVLYVGGQRTGGNGPDWVRAIERQGFAVLPFDSMRHLEQSSRIEQAIARRTGLGRHITALNRELRALAEQEEFDFAFVAKGMQVYASTVKTLAKRSTRNAVLHLTIDSMFTDNRSRHFFAAIPHYHTVFTDKSFELDAYRAAGAKHVTLFDQPYGLRFDDHEAIAEARNDQPASDVCFIGHCQPHYVRTLKAVSDMGVDLKIWGPGWSALAKSETWARRHVMGEGLWGAAYPAAMSRAKIGLGLLSKRIPEEATTRSVEIPAAGTFLMAERSSRHSAMFKEGLEAEFFDDLDEMRDKIATYLADDEGRERIAGAGAARARRSYNMVETMTHLLSEAGQLQTTGAHEDD